MKKVTKTILLTFISSIFASSVYAGAKIKNKSHYYQLLGSNRLKVSKDLQESFFEAKSNKFIVYYKKGSVFKRSLLKDKNLNSLEAKRRWKDSIRKVILINRVLKSFKNFPIKYVSLKTNKEKVQLLKNDQVLFVAKNKEHRKSLRESLHLINQPDVREMGYGGKGTSVAVLDTGVDYMRSTFGKCRLAPIGSNYPGGNCKVIFSKDFSSEMRVGRYVPKDDGHLDDDNHGTNVAGIIANIAPQTKILSLDVFTRYKRGEKTFNTASTIDIIHALDWVVENKEKYNIVAANLSLGDSSQYGKDCSQQEFHYSEIFKKVINVGIIPVVAAGNEGLKTEVGSPACVKSALTVGSVTDTTDRVSSFSNGGKLVDILAPGESIRAAGIRMSGTSQATPHVSGAIAVLKGQNIFQKEKVESVINALKENAPMVTDYRTGIRFPRLDLLESIKSAEGQKELPLEWKLFPKKELSIDQESDIPTLIFEAFDPNGNDIFYKIKNNTCPLKLEGKRLNNEFILDGRLEKTDKRSCIISILASTKKKKSSIGRIKITIRPLKEIIRPIQWVKVPKSLSINVRRGGRIEPIFFQAFDPNGEKLDYKLTSNGKCWDLLFGKEKKGVELFGNVPKNTKIKECTVFVHAFTKNKKARVLKIKFKIEGFLLWKKRPGLFYKVNAGSFIPKILMEAYDPNGKRVFYKIMESTCPWKFKLEKTKNILSIRGKVPYSVKGRSCSIKISPFTETKKGETLVLNFDIKETEEKGFLKWDYAEGAFFQEVLSGEGTQIVKLKAKSSNNESIRYTVKKSCPMKLKYNLKNNILFFKAHTIKNQGAGNCELIFKAHSRGAKSISKRMIVKIIRNNHWYAPVRNYLIIFFERVNNFFS
ncbi:MAG: S8 family serine peptidase [Bdellovibrionota bacterium]|nr:S8 family serine peptidase [Bdellovibrionota bacterium]